MELIDLDELFAPNGSPDKKPRNNNNSLKNQNNKKNKKKSVLSELLHFIITILTVLFASYFIVVFIAQRTEVHGSSMETTLSDKDNLVIDKISYRISKPKRFDIIVFPHENNGETIYYIKRVIGLPGEQIQISDGVIYVDNVPLEENFGYEVMEDAKLAASPIVLGDDEYFVLGDNRNHSSDSREIGAVKRDKIVGKAVFRVWPLDKLAILK